MDTLFIPGWLITGLIVAIIIVVLLVKGYVNAKPNEVVVITGLRKQRHLRGKDVYKRQLPTLLEHCWP